MAISDELQDHLAGAETTLCRCWAIKRSDGEVYGFTDHDQPLTFEGVTFKADSGLTAYALQQATGLSVDNSEALGVLSDAGLTETDIDAGRFDQAEVRAWLVNWSDPNQRWLQFRGTIGEIKRAGGAFEAELRGLTEALNAPLGRIYQKPCTAVLGDAQCRFDLEQPGYTLEVTVQQITDDGHLLWDALEGYLPDWFTRGRLGVVTGAAQGLWAAIKSDQQTETGRALALWQPLGAPLQTGDVVRLQAGCDKRSETCRQKFDNYLNFQGFPDIPGEDWMLAVPKSGRPNTGGSLR